MNTTLLFVALAITSEPPPLVIDKLNVDCGTVSSAKPLTQSFQLKNTGSVPLTIVDVAGSCGCVRRNIGDKVIAAGATTELTLGFNLLTQPEGPNNWSATIRYRVGDDGKISEQVVRVAAKIKKDVTVEPAALMLSAEREIVGTLTVRDRRGKPLTVTGVRIGLKDVQTEVKPAVNVANGREQKITLAVAESAKPGQYADEICIDTDDPEFKELRVPLRIIKKTTASGVESVPGSVTLRFAKDQPTATSLVRLRDADDGNVAIDKVECDHPAIACKWAAGPGTMATLRVTVDLEKAKGAGIAAITVRIKSPASETILIPVSWTVP